MSETVETAADPITEYAVVNQFKATVISEGKPLVFPTYDEAHDALTALVLRYGADVKFDVEIRRK